MNFYVVSNGWIGEGYLRVYVVAENEDRAKELASEVFKREGVKRVNTRKSFHGLEYLTIEHCLDGRTEGVVDMVDY